MGAIHFFCEDIKFTLPEKLRHKNWIKEIIIREGGKLNNLNYIFCSDQFLHQINLQYLNHDDYTDIISFDESDYKDEVSGDIYISIERIKDNSIKYQQEFYRELRRVIIHGVLHLLGYSDKKANEKKYMTQKENESLALWEIPDVPRGTSGEPK